MMCTGYLLLTGFSHLGMPLILLFFSHSGTYERRPLCALLSLTLTPWAHSRGNPPFLSNWE